VPRAEAVRAAGSRGKRNRGVRRNAKCVQKVNVAWGQGEKKRDFQQSVKQKTMALGHTKKTKVKKRV